MKEEILVFGAGALSLGFLGPMLSGNYKLIFCDLEIKKNLIEFLRKENNYLVNICCSTKIIPLKVFGVSGFNLSRVKERNQVKKILKKIKIIFTAVGSKGIDETLSFIEENSGKDREEKLYVFSAENDKTIFKRWRGRLGKKIKLCDTIMGRMCRVEKTGKCYQSVGSRFKEAVIAEDFYGLPVSAKVYHQAGLKGKTWQVMPEKEFEARAELKLFGHNGAHLFLSHLGALQGLTYFYQINSKDLSEVKSFLDQEVGPAILHQYGEFLKPIEVKKYCAKLIQRLIRRTFSDTIERGIRNSLDKITSSERLVKGAKFVLKNGITPKYFCRIIALVIKLNIKKGLLSGPVDKIISHHCRIKEKKLISLIKNNFGRR
ncbi:MAG: hypothetical protein COZ37_01180 [bacterium (Candidatus Ratteibacteria) CG_4_10_14_3_um_filter_41_18]|uniref:Mannitol dehydrogenase C-terminal domain-containing protein n=4 Tax=Candidatus Ratteibacteria TaxID=2979319 RepID=A0A2M7EAU8_9BACT|nr:MAG: hypothetical protein AUJ76_02295 [Candidatus Omnitrophica bacterium CG1_02_41_171]PIV64805.1 MAG: hypothetical protein COS11_00275 [bacterium (Candidatus Ratteibacteria) CG01_land_8_20_14_3_00_40_19]PIW34083.1 MAG: hypothetical protein COW28_01165 [bacterium (Candidatus Ratteibacteria) CG15_BIG_FIL_POST_REV_8_21_14_020_41_12]PIW74330.1 MAG: hypothetical protein CO004_01270 [bacterium (Candidatus Ratteibacteria) CG_4_8_14_3_um_filter_41_36]PIX77725.1 MAG: hypothetical protein COZ37_01180